MSSLKDLPITTKIALAAAGAIAGYFIYKKIKKNFAMLPPVFPLPTGGGGMPVVSYDDKGQPTFWNPAPLSNELFDVMDGYFSTAPNKDKAWAKFTNLPTSDMQVSVYNHFNKNFGNGETLTQWINDENLYDYFSGGKEIILSKLSSLGLP
jgi:hypothetical protein